MEAVLIQSRCTFNLNFMYFRWVLHVLGIHCILIWNVFVSFTRRSTKQHSFRVHASMRFQYKINFALLELHVFPDFLLMANAEMLLFEKFPEIRKLQLHFRNSVTHISVVALRSSACNYEVLEIFSCPSGISATVNPLKTKPAYMRALVYGKCML